jgi:hypothetical protein
MPRTVSPINPIETVISESQGSSPFLQALNRPAALGRKVREAATDEDD